MAFEFVRCLSHAKLLIAKQFVSYRKHRVPSKQRVQRKKPPLNKSILLRNICTF